MRMLRTPGRCRATCAPSGSPSDVGPVGVWALPATASVPDAAVTRASSRSAMASSRWDQVQSISPIPSNKVSPSGPAAARSLITARCPAVIRPSPDHSAMSSASGRPAR